MNKYLELKEKQQQEVNAFPIYWAIGDKQWQERLVELGLTDSKEDIEKLVGIGGGGFMLKKDFLAYIEMRTRHAAERQQAIDEDTTGEGYIYDMFHYELGNHEFGYTRCADQTLDALGYTREDIDKEPRLKKAFKKACKARIDWDNKNN